MTWVGDGEGCPDLVGPGKKQFLRLVLQAELAFDVVTVAVAAWHLDAAAKPKRVAAGCRVQQFRNMIPVDGGGSMHAHELIRI